MATHENKHWLGQGKRHPVGAVTAFIMGPTRLGMGQQLRELVFIGRRRHVTLRRRTNAATSCLTVIGPNFITFQGLSRCGTPRTALRGNNVTSRDAVHRQGASHEDQGLSEHAELQEVSAPLRHRHHLERPMYVYLGSGLDKVVPIRVDRFTRSLRIFSARRREHLLQGTQSAVTQTVALRIPVGT